DGLLVARYRLPEAPRHVDGGLAGDDVAPGVPAAGGDEGDRVRADHRVTLTVWTVVRYRSRTRRSSWDSVTMRPAPGVSSRYEYDPLVSDATWPATVGEVRVRSTMPQTSATTSAGTCW